MAADGKVTLTVSAGVSESVTTAVHTEVTNFSCSGSGPSRVCTPIGGPSSSDSSETVTKTGTAGSASTTYVLDINPPTLTLKSAGPSQISQGSNKPLHGIMFFGSAGTDYTLNYSASGPGMDGPYTVIGNGLFGPGNDGIAPRENDPASLHIPCDATPGVYTATASANTEDLGGNSFDPVPSTDFNPNLTGNDGGAASVSFTVTPAITLTDQTLIVADLPPSGDYAPMTCFTSGASGKKISTSPGSLHVTATVNVNDLSGGNCAASGTFAATKIKLFVPQNFKFDTTGSSPAAHVFIGPAVNGFDYHNPAGLAEVTGLITKPRVAVDGTITVDLSQVNLGFGPGNIPVTSTIYVRAHASYSGTTVPANGQTFVFTTQTDASLGAFPFSNSSTSTLTASPACVNGNL
jgi:hypothetical protein